MNSQQHQQQEGVTHSVGEGLELTWHCLKISEHLNISEPVSPTVHPGCVHFLLRSKASGIEQASKATEGV